ncbi:MAG: GNAT family N-acetyltransferase [Burkholderiaceae bacterium]|jgi:ribosomal protein S18 acetylase RimI-like enzyme|nr:MAG: GNAT family N-acetyltransferase [Burkholderiaceae bacterium]
MTNPLSQSIRITAAGAPQMALVHTLFLEYARGLGIDLCFQDFEQELSSLPGKYAAPRGALLLARVGEAAAGCIAMRGIALAEHPNACEMKRLYVRPAFRGLGLGRRLADAVLEAARSAGYACMLLDTLEPMRSAQSLYRELGFVEIPRYYDNPLPGARYLKLDLR